MRLFDAVLRQVVAERALADAHQLGGVLLDAAATARARGGSVSRSTHSRFWCSRSDGSAGVCVDRRRRAPRSSRAVSIAPGRRARRRARSCSRARARCPASRTAAAPPARRPRRRRSACRCAARACATKCSTSSGMSSRRSRSGGMWIGNDVQPVEQILLELAVGDQLPQVAVGGGDDADVDLLGALGAERLELALLQHAQQLGLQRRRHRADLVEEDACRRRPARTGPSWSSSRR